MYWKEAYKEKIIPPEELATKIPKIREGKTLATLNGSFDLMHAGHLHIIYEASKAGDLLLVALNTDTSIQQYKSPDRPIVPLEYRLQMMAALEFVDYVTWFEETDPRNLLEIIKPDVHVNGAPYGQDCIEAPVIQKHGGKVVLIDLIDGLSTSAIIEKITKT